MKKCLFVTRLLRKIEKRMKVLIPKEKIRYWNVEIEDHSEIPSRWTVSALKCPWMVLLLALS